MMWIVEAPSHCKGGGQFPLIQDWTRRFRPARSTAALPSAERKKTVFASPAA